MCHGVCVCGFVCVVRERVYVNVSWCLCVYSEGESVCECV